MEFNPQLNCNFCSYIFCNQGYSRSLMLSLILDSAIHWIKAGLLLKNLKIVVYSRSPQNYDKSFEELFKCFQEFKCNYDDKELVFVSMFATFILYIELVNKDQSAMEWRQQRWHYKG